MGYIYSAPRAVGRDSNSASPVEVFFQRLPWEEEGLPGWYWWIRSPGYEPESDPSGPFATEAEAIDDAQGGN
jgi:hypothetical protein